MNILSIDAWGNAQDGWQWNAWYKVGTISKDEFDNLTWMDGFIQYFIDNNYVLNNPNLFYVEDDGYNIVITAIKTNEPLFAIEYGCEY